MTISEARRRDLYNGLDELLGTARADTLMAYLPAYEITELATKDDIRRLEDRFDRSEGAIGNRFDRLEDRIESGLDAVNKRLDRFFITQSAGLIAIVGALIAAVLL